MSQTTARVAAHPFLFGYFAALEQWYLDGGVHPIADYVDGGSRFCAALGCSPPEDTRGQFEPQ